MTTPNARLTPESARLERLFERDRLFGRQRKHAQGMLDHLTIMISSALTLRLPLETGDARQDHLAVLNLFREVVTVETAKTFDLFGIESSKPIKRRCTAVGPDGIRCGGILGHTELHHALIETSLLNEPEWRDA